MRESESLNDYVYRVLKNEILLCNLAPGAEISEALLTERYCLSKAPLRSALARLRQEGLVLSRGRMGNVVAPITIQDLREIFQLRLLLEVEATRLAAGKIDPDRLKTLDANVRRCHQSQGKATAQAYREANHEFHSYVVSASGNQRLSEMVIGLIEQHQRIVHFSLTLHNRDSEFLHIHDKLVDALLSGDRDRAAEITEKTIRGSQKRIMESLVSTDTPFVLTRATASKGDR
jgi:DNA-binding GntR family transcriptional regulator